jgi:PAS domain S-box-containing protein
VGADDEHRGDPSAPSVAAPGLVAVAELRDRLQGLVLDMDRVLARSDVEAADALLARLPQVLPAEASAVAASAALEEPAGQGTIDLSGTLHAANSGLVRLLRVPSDRVHGRGVHACIARDARPEWFGLVRRVFGEGERAEIQVPLRSRQDDPRWVRIVATPLPVGPGAVPRALVLFYDVSEERAALARLRQSEEGFRSLIERLPEAVVVHRSGVVGYANPAAGRCFGVVDPVELLGELVEHLVATEDVEAARAEWIEAARSHRARSPRSVRMRRTDGSTWLAQVTDLPVVFDGHWQVVTVAHDLTEQRAVQARLMLADRLSSMGILAAGLAHEINNPLQYMMANTQLVRADLKQVAAELRSGRDPDRVARRAEEVNGYLADVAAGERRVAELVRELRGFSRVSNQRVPVSLAAVVRAALRVAGNELQFRARVEVELPDDLPQVFGDEGRLFQVFLNLLVNAAQAIPAGAPEDHLVAVRARAADDSVVVVVTDTGCGMSKEHAAHAFEPFFTTKEVGEGTGLGLAICASIVRGMGGDIHVQSDPDAGAAFTLRLPLEPTAAEDEERVPVYPSPALPAVARRRLLIIDDEPAIRDALSRAIGVLHEVVAVASAEDAIRLLADDDTFDLVLSDVLMDRGGGPELHAWISSARPALLPRLVFMTGGAFLPRAAEFVQRVDRPVLEKPIRVRDVVRLLDLL